LPWKFSVRLAVNKSVLIVSDKRARSRVAHHR
jgi:hypothetical protein